MITIIITGSKKYFFSVQVSDSQSKNALRSARVLGPEPRVLIRDSRALDPMMLAQSNGAMAFLRRSGTAEFRKPPTRPP